MKPVWNKDSTFALKFNKFISWPLGVWPLDYDSAFSHFRLGFSFMSQLWYMCVQLAPAYLHCGNATAVVEYVMLSTCAFMSMSKIVTFRVHAKKMRTIVLSAMNDWISVDDEQDRLVMRSFAKTGRFVFQLQIGFSYLTLLIMIIGNLPFLMPPMVTNGTLFNMSDTTEITMRELPLKTGCLFAHYRDAIYGFFYVYESIMVIISTHANVGCDVFLFSLLMHICGQIELMKKDLREIDTGCTEAQEQISKFIQKHGRLLEMAEAIKVTCSGMLLVQLFCNAGLNLMLGVRIILALQSNTIADTIKPLLALAVIMLQLYLISYASDCLCSQFESILDALYESKWFELPLKLQKNLCFVAMRANIPVNLVAGQFYTLNVENFKNTLKASFSYFSIMRVMFDA